MGKTISIPQSADVSVDSKMAADSLNACKLFCIETVPSRNSILLTTTADVAENLILTDVQKSISGGRRVWRRKGAWHDLNDADYRQLMFHSL